MFILNILDTFSKFVWSAPIKNKNDIAVSKAFEKIIQSAKSQNHKPHNLLHTDKGTEFGNKGFKTLLNTYNIKMYHTQILEKSAIIERFHRTLTFTARASYRLGRHLHLL
jgi:transposase InsO family protein